MVATTEESIMNTDAADALALSLGVDPELLELREQILAIDTTYDYGNGKTKQFLPPNFYIKRLVQFMQAHEAEIEQQHVENYRWLLGYTDDVPSEPSKRFAWRSELRKRLPESILEQLERNPS